MRRTLDEILAGCYMTCVIDDDAHHYTECTKCDGSWFLKPECKPEECPICKNAGHTTGYIRVLKDCCVTVDGYLRENDEKEEPVDK